MRLPRQIFRGMWHKSEMSNGEESGQDFYSARSDNSEEDPVPKDGSTDTDSATPLMRTSSANERSHVLTEEENRLMNERIDRLVAVIQAGRQLQFSPDPQTGNVDVSIAHDKSDSDEGRSDIEADIAASPEHFGNIVRAGDTRRRVASPNSALFDSTVSSEVINNFSSSAWESVLAAVDIRYAVEHGSEAQITPVRKNNPAGVQGVVRRDGQYITYIDKNDVKVGTVSSIPLDFNKRPRTSTPSIHSTGSDLDCSSPLFEKSLQVLLRETSGDVSKSEDASQGSESSGIRDRVSDWLKRVKTPTILGEQSDAYTKRKGFNVFQDGRKHEPAPKGNREHLTANKALKDVSNLRRPGYLQYNSFAQTSRVNKPIADSTQWPVLVSNRESRKTLKSTTPRQISRDQTHSTPHTRRRRHKYPSPQNPALQDPNRTVDSDLALAKLEGRAPPQQYSPIRRYADESGLYGPDVLVEKRPLRYHQPMPMRLLPFGLSVAQKFEKAVAEWDDDEGGIEKVGVDKENAGRS